MPAGGCTSVGAGATPGLAIVSASPPRPFSVAGPACVGMDRKITGPKTGSTAATPITMPMGRARENGDLHCRIKIRPVNQKTSPPIRPTTKNSAANNDAFGGSSSRDTS